ncbi:MAG: hypothetical protein RR475_07865 [Clostridia bacterium]
MKQNHSVIERTLGSEEMQSQQTIPQTNPHHAQEPAFPGMRQDSMDENSDFEEIVGEFYELIRKGELPQSFDIKTACEDPAFADLLAQYPADASVRIYTAEQKAAMAESNAMQQMTDRVKTRNALPRSQRGAAMPAPVNDYAGMSSESFRTLLQQAKKMARNGGKTRL